MNRIKLQMPEVAGVLPYPYFIDEKGMVERQASGALKTPLQ